MVSPLPSPSPVIPGDISALASEHWLHLGMGLSITTGSEAPSGDSYSDPCVFSGSDGFPRSSAPHRQSQRICKANLGSAEL